jgi:hypothetical protein
MCEYADPEKPGQVVRTRPPLGGAGIRTFAHPHIRTSAYPHIVTFAHRHIRTSAHPPIRIRGLLN